jgi:hypothetical protein
MEVSGQLYVPLALPQAPNIYEAGWAPEPGWTLWMSENYLASFGNQTLAVQPVARRYTDLIILTKLHFSCDENQNRRTRDVFKHTGLQS